MGGWLGWVGAGLWIQTLDLGFTIMSHWWELDSKVPLPVYFYKKCPLKALFNMGHGQWGGSLTQKYCCLELLFQACQFQIYHRQQTHTQTQSRN